MDNTTRKHPRSSVEAFPRTCGYACSLERPAPRLTRFGWIVAIVILSLIVSTVIP